MNTLPAAASRSSVSALTLASSPAAPREAQDANPSPFSQALSEADSAGSHGGANPHRSRGNADGKAMPPDGNVTPSTPPPAAAPVVPAGPLPAVPVDAGAAPQVSAAIPAISSAPAVAALAQADLTRASAGSAAANAGVAATNAGGPRPSAAGRASATATRPAAAAALADADTAEAAAGAGVADTDPATMGVIAAGSAALASAEAVVAAPDRLAEPDSVTPAAGGRSAATLQLPATAGGAAGSDAGPQSAGATVAADPVLPVFSLHGAADRHDDPPAAGAPGPGSGSTPVGAAAGVVGPGAMAAAQGAGSPPVVAPAPPQPASPNFPEQLAAHVAFVVDQSLNGATLQVSPPQLGPIELRVSIDAGHAQVWLSAHNATTVDALQQGSAALRELLSGQGFGQVSVDVSQRSFQERQGGAPAYVFGGAHEESTVPAVTSGASVSPAARRTAPGILDAYA